MSGFNLYWGDFHKHLVDMDRCDQIIDYAKYNLDVYCVLCYPFQWDRVKGARIESVRQRPDFLEWWKRLRTASRDHNREGDFVTFLGYEWHGNRTEYGDHNVIYFEDGPLDDAWELENLFSHLRNRDALAIPHHTAYIPEHRGKNWDVIDSSLCPVMEIYSTHGSSEGVDTRVKMEGNRSMGPRTSGGNFRDALDRGIRIGCIASNDSAGLPGSWPLGIAGIWAKSLTREAIWEALKDRRTIASTGDRINLWFEINGKPLGSIMKDPGKLEGRIDVECPQPLDRVELIHNGQIIETYCHAGKWGVQEEGIFKILVEFGWGPAKRYGFEDVQQEWAGRLRVINGQMIKVEPRFSGLGQRFHRKKDSCSFELTTSRDGRPSFRQGLIFTIEGGKSTTLNLSIDDREFSLDLIECLDSAHLFPFMEESIERVESTFGLKEKEVRNPDIYYHNARKVKFHPAYPRDACLVGMDLQDLPIDEGNNYYYVRVQQEDGQTAWSSPIWVE